MAAGARAGHRHDRALGRGAELYAPSGCAQALLFHIITVSHLQGNAGGYADLP